MTRLILMGLKALEKAVEENYGYALATPIFYSYFGSVSLVENPNTMNQEIKAVELNYHWSGLGEPSEVEYSLNITNANTSPLIKSELSFGPYRYRCKQRGNSEIKTWVE